jgi:hypothetical protein
MSRRRRAILLALIVAFAVVPLPHANACTCVASFDSRDRLAAADGAFIGRLVGRRETGPLGSTLFTGRDVIYTFAVTEVFKGDIGQRVEVHSAASGASCGFEVSRGQAVGVFLHGDQGRWGSSLCGQIDPGKLRAAAAPLPVPDGRPPAALVVGGSFGEARLLTLDRHTRTLAYGYGTGHTTQLSICPGGKRLLEVVQDHRKPSRLALRKLPGLDLVWELPLPPQPPSISPQSVQCLDGTGTGNVFASNGGDPTWYPTATLLRVSRTTTTVLYQGAARSIAFGRDVGYVNEGRWGEAIGRINLHTGQLTPVITGPRYMTRLALDPDGSALATQVRGDDLTRMPGGDRSGTRPPQAVVIDLNPSPPRVRTAPLGRANQTQTGRSARGTMVWLNTNRLGFFPTPGAHPRARIFDRSLRELGGLDDWVASTSLLVGKVLVGLGQGRLTTANLPNGPTRLLQQLQSPQMIAMAALPGATRISPPSQAARAPAPPGPAPAPPGAAPVPQPATPAPPGDAEFPVLPLAAGAAAMVLLAVLLLFGRARRRRPDA